VELECDIDIGTENLFNTERMALVGPARPVGPIGPVRILDVLPGGSAQLAGLRPGDVITQIDGRDLNPTTAPQAVPRLSTAAPDGAAVNVSLTVKRPERDELIHVKLTPAVFRPETVFGIRRHLDHSWDHWLDAKAKIGYVRIGFIDHWTDPFSGETSGGTDMELHDVLSELLRSGMRGLVVDLRGCPGGFINPAVSLIGLFAKDALVATTTTANLANPQPRKYSTSAIDEPLVRGIPIIVLVNEDTVGGGEMIAAALRDNNVAEIAGQRTFGKGSVQTTNLLPNSNVQYKLTTGLIFRKNGNALQRMPDAKAGVSWGVSPDPGLEIPLTPDMNKQLKEWMHQQVLRPGDRREKLPLDDPENDPARQFVLREMLKRVK
jgi:carboxyl-terminal processing protease